MYLNNSESEIAKLFAAHFKGLYSNLILPEYGLNVGPHEVLEDITISKD